MKELESTVSEYRNELERMRLLTQQLQRRVAGIEKVQINVVGTAGCDPGNYGQPWQMAGYYGHQDAYRQRNNYNGNMTMDIQDIGRENVYRHSHLRHPAAE